MRTKNIFPLRETKPSDPAELAKAGPNEVWKTGTGVRVLVKDMESQHIMYSMRQLERRCATTGRRFNDSEIQLADIAAEMFPIYKVMERELQKRIRKAKTVTSNKPNHRKFRHEAD